MPGRPSRPVRRESPLRQARKARNWTLERLVEEIDLRTPGVIRGSRRAWCRAGSSVGTRRVLPTV
jgi:hypothetical protein